MEREELTQQYLLDTEVCSFSYLRSVEFEGREEGRAAAAAGTQCLLLPTQAFLCPQNNSRHIAKLVQPDKGQWRWTYRKERSISGKLTDKQRPWLQDSSRGLSSDDLAELENTLQRVAHNCIAFGLQLGVEDHRIKVIEAQYANPCDRLREILHYRLRQLPLLTWQDIAKALRTDAVQENVLASEIECQHTN